jgi:MFS family permease
MALPSEKLEQVAIQDGNRNEHLESQGGPPSISYFRFIFDQAPLTPAILTWPYEGSGTVDDPYVVCWIDNDPRNPMLFSNAKKWSLTLMVAFVTLAVALVSSAYSGAIPETAHDFHVSEEVVISGISLYVLGFGTGPILWAPMSELYGRQLILFISIGIMTAFNVGAAAAPSITSLLIFRFFAGAFGASPLTNAGGVIADMFPASQRGIAMTYFAVAPFMGPGTSSPPRQSPPNHSSPPPLTVLGPIIGGFLGQAHGWRWVAGLMAILTGTLWLASALTCPETYPPVLLRKRAAALSRHYSSTSAHYLSKLEISAGPITPRAAFKTAILRPWRLLFREPIVLLLSMYMSFEYGTLYMLFAAFPIVYRDERGWNEGVSGLAFLAIAVGMALAVLYMVLENRRYVRSTPLSGSHPPEERLKVAMVGGIALPLGLFVFAWTNSPSIHYLVSMSASSLFGFGLVLIFVSIKNYLVDAYTIFAASALAATVITRSLFGAAFPLFTGAMYSGLGIHWASSVPAFMALACTPLPFLFYRYGAKIRERCKYAAIAGEHLKDIEG